MNDESIFGGVCVALTTPLRENRQIDENALKRHLRFLESNGITHVLCAGTTGEFSSLSRKQKHNLFDAVRENFAGKMTVNVSNTSLLDVKNNIACAITLGADAISLMPPYYFANAPEDGIVDFLNEAINFSGVPCMLYNFTRHTQNRLTPDILRRIPNACALKDSDKNDELIAHTPLYVCGGDSSLLDFYKKGARGVVSVMGNYAPALVVQLWREMESKNFDEAAKTQRTIREIAGIFRKIDQIARIKYALSRILDDYPTQILPPLLPPTSEAKNEVDLLFERKILG